MDPALMVFLHGPGQSPPAWQDVVGAINPTQPMVAPWLKGLKPTEHEGFDMGAAVESLADLLEVRGAERADLIGFSLGGLVALRFAQTYPAKVGHIVLISTPVIPSQAMIRKERALMKFTPSVLFRGVDKEHMLAALDALAEANIGVNLAEVKAPILGIFAQSDPVGMASSEALARDAKAMTRALPGANPDLLRTAPANLAELISDFCADFLDPE